MNKGIAILAVVALLMTGCSAPDSRLIFTGSVEAKEIDVSPEITGNLKVIPVHEGDLVQAGKPLMVLDTSDYEIQLKTLQTQKNIASLKSKDLNNGSRPAEIRQARANLSNMEAQIRGAEQELSFLNKDYSNQKALYDSGASSQQQLDAAQRALDKEQTLYQSLTKQRDALAASLNLIQEGATSEAKGQAVLNVTLNDLQIQDLQRTIGKGTLKAPSDALIQSLNYEVGERLTPGLKAVTLLDLSRMEVKIYVPEKQLYRVKRGMSVDFQEAFLKGKDIKGTVTYISSKAEFTPKNIESKENKQEMVYEVRIHIDDHSGIIKPGMFLDVELKEGQS